MELSDLSGLPVLLCYVPLEGFVHLVRETFPEHITQPQSLQT